MFVWQIRISAQGFQNLHLVSVHFIGELVSYREDLYIQHCLCWTALDTS